MAAPTKRISLRWQHGMAFEGGPEGKPPIAVDGDGKTGPGPMDTLLVALAACTASDVVSILEKMRLPVQAMTVDVVGERRPDHPKRYTSIVLTYRVRAAGAREEQVRHAIDLSLGKYCSVTHSLAPDIARRYELVLEA
ncbi:MAG TPA: OsmC family protein [Gemmatimonadales bacterium]|nr:OsmC family protein [Gemmatimonadales bacterium]